MPNVRTFYWGVAAACLFGCVSSDSGARDPESPISVIPEQNFFELLSAGYNVDYTLTQTPDELAGYSDLVLVGEIAELEEGGTVGGAHSSVARVEGLQMVKGSHEAPVVYVELLHSPTVSTEELQAALPVPAGLWFLQDSADVVAPSSLDQNRGMGVPAGERLMGPASRQGFVIDDGEELSQPLEPHREAWFSNLHEYSSLADLIADIR